MGLYERLFGENDEASIDVPLADEDEYSTLKGAALGILVMIIFLAVVMTATPGSSRP